MDAQKNLTPPDETVSQSEIKALLALVGNTEPTKVESAPSEAGKSRSVDSHLSTRYEFPQVSSFSAAELRKLRMRHEEYVRSLAARLSAYLRLECSLQMAKFETMSFQQFADTLSSPTHLTLFNVEPLEGICFLDIPPKLGLCIVDRELGGPAHTHEDTRDLSNIEATLLTRAVEIITNEWCLAWGDLLDLRSHLIRHETDGRFVQVVKSDEMMLVLGLDFKIGEISEQVQIALLFSTLEPIIHKLNDSLAKAKESSSPQPVKSMKWNPLFDNVDLELKAQLPEIEVTAEQISRLKIGDVLRLDSSAAEGVRLQLAGMPRFTASLGTCGKQLAVKISGRSQE